MKRLFVAILILLTVLLSACKGPITKHEYSREEIAKVLLFIGISADRVNKYLKGEITLQDLQISKERLERAIAYIEQLKKEKDNNTKESPKEQDDGLRSKN